MSDNNDYLSQNKVWIPKSDDTSDPNIQLKKIIKINKVIAIVKVIITVVLIAVFVLTSF